MLRGGQVNIAAVINKVQQPFLLLLLAHRQQVFRIDAVRRQQTNQRLDLVGFRLDDWRRRVVVVMRLLLAVAAVVRSCGGQTIVVALASMQHRQRPSCTHIAIITITITRSFRRVRTMRQTHAQPPPIHTHSQPLFLSRSLRSL